MAGPGAPIGNENAAKGKEWRLAIRRALAHKYGSYSDGLLALAGKLVEAAVLVSKSATDSQPPFLAFRGVLISYRGAH